jgi:signal transduction histidine kinase
VEGFYLESAPRKILLNLSAAAVWVTADRVKLTQALNNVLSNACKYSPQDGTIQVQLLSRESRPGREVGVSVTDQGIGMTESQLARIYERFFRADPSGAVGGTGLGMTLVKEFLELMGGSVEVTSALGTGTTVTLWLQAAAPPEDAPA